MTWSLMKIFFLGFLALFLLFFIYEDVKNVAITNDPCYSDYESDDESNYGYSNSEMGNIRHFRFWKQNFKVLHLVFFS